MNSVVSKLYCCVETYIFVSTLKKLNRSCERARFNLQLLKQVNCFQMISLILSSPVFLEATSHASFGDLTVVTNV